MAHHGITGIDHTLVGVEDLEAARLNWTRLGFTLSPRGRHIGWGTGNYCVMFPGDYIELLGIIEAGQPTNGLDRKLAESGEGGLGLAFAGKSAEAAAESLQRRGIGAGPVEDLARQLELPEGTVLPRFRLLRPEAESLPGLSAFLCQHATPELLRRPEWLSHENHAVGLASVTVVASDPVALELPYERFFGPASVTRTDDILVVRVGRQQILFASEDDVEAMHPGLVTEGSQTGFRSGQLVMMSLLSDDLDATADRLAAWQIDFEEHRDALLVPPDQANGVALEFLSA